MLWVFIDAIPAFIMVQMWTYLERSGRLSATQTAQLSVYYLLTLVISRLSTCHFEDWLMKDIRDGAISMVFVKPLNYPVFLIANELMWRASGMIYLIPVFLLMGARAEYFSILVLNPLNILVVLGVLLLAFFIRFTMSWILSLAAFWIDEASFLVHLKWGMEGFLGGQFLPLTFFPLLLQQVSKYSPFYLWYQVPIGLLTGTLQLNQIGTGVFVGCMWLVALTVFSKVLWKQAIKKYSAVGG